MDPQMIIFARRIHGVLIVCGNKNHQFRLEPVTKQIYATSTRLS